MDILPELSPIPDPSSHKPPPVWSADVQEIHRFTRGREHRSPIARLAQAILHGQAQHPLDIPSVVKSLEKPSSEQWKERLAACWTLAHTPQNEREREAAARWLVYVLEHYPRLDGEQRWKRAYLRTIFLCLLPMVPTFGLGAITAPFVAFPLSFIVLPFSSALDKSRMNRVRAMAAQSLGRLNVAQAVYSLAGGAADRDVRVRHESIWSLLSILPLLSESHIGHLEKDTVPRLCRLLFQTGFTEAGWISLLTALGKIGDGRAVPYVERLANHGVSVGIQEEARRILPILYDRRKREQEASRLVRAADSPEGLHQTLLRPYDSTGEADPQVLVRAIGAETPEE